MSSVYVWYVCMYVCMHVCMYVCMYGCMYFSSYIHTYVHMYVFLYACLYVCMYAYYDICMYIIQRAKRAKLTLSRVQLRFQIYIIFIGERA